ncbi:MAG: hypothetical protein ACYC7D_11545 [Nitrososphaerales archaeon]
MPATNRIESTELFSFLLVAGSMLASAIIFFPGYFVFFVVLALIDGASTYAKVRLFLSLDRALFGLALILMSAILASFSVLELIVETLLLIAVLDFSFMLRGLSPSGNSWSIVRTRLKSYLFSIVPAGVFAIGTVYIYSVVLLSSAPEPVLELGLASAGTFLLILYLMRALISINSHDELA